MEKNINKDDTYVFFINLSDNPWDQTEWKEYEQHVQIDLNNSYKNYLLNRKDICVNLPSPLNKYKINFDEMLQSNIQEPQLVRQIKFEKVQKNVSVKDVISKRSEKLKENKIEEKNLYKFSWVTNKDWHNLPKVEWNWYHYNKEIQPLLNEVYEIYLKDNSKKCYDIAINLDGYQIDFGEMLQSNISNPNLKRPIKVEEMFIDSFVDEHPAPN